MNFNCSAQETDHGSGEGNRGWGSEDNFFIASTVRMCRWNDPLPPTPTPGEGAVRIIFLIANTVQMCRWNDPSPTLIFSLLYIYRLSNSTLSYIYSAYKSIKVTQLPPPTLWYVINIHVHYINVFASLLVKRRSFSLSHHSNK